MLSADCVRRILQLHAQCGVPLVHSVPFALRLRGYGVVQTAEEIGVSRTFFFLALRGDKRAGERFRQIVAERLGANPWDPIGVEERAPKVQ